MNIDDNILFTTNKEILEKNLVIGFRQVTKMLDKTPEKIKCVVLAKDIDSEIFNYIDGLVSRLNIELNLIDTSKKLGKLAGIDVPASAIALKTGCKN